jgi:hypothetical protein
MYRFFRSITSIPASRLENPASLLVAAGFASRIKMEMERELLYAQLWQRRG